MGYIENHIAALEDRIARAEAYRRMREQRPWAPALTIWNYLFNNEAGESWAAFTCPGHEWAYTGTAYGGDDERFHGEGRAYCVHCGTDGDA